MATLMAPGPTRMAPARLQRYGSAEDMRKEASLPAPATVQSAATPSLTPLPSQRQVSHPHGLVPSLQSILLNKVIQGIIDQTYTSLDLGYDMLTELATRLQAKRLLTDENVGLFASLPELFLNNCPISDKGLRNLLEKSEMHSVVGLHLENTNITDASLGAVLRYSPSIRVLDVSKCSQLSERGLLSIIEHCVELRYLGMRDVTAATDSVVSAAMALPHLLRLDIDGAHRLTDYLVAGHRLLSSSSDHAFMDRTLSTPGATRPHVLAHAHGASSSPSSSPAPSLVSPVPRAASMSSAHLASTSALRADLSQSPAPVFEMPVALATPSSLHSTNFMKSEASTLRIPTSEALVIGTGARPCLRCSAPGLCHTQTHVSGLAAPAPLAPAPSSSTLRSPRAHSLMRLSPIEELSASGLSLSAGALSSFLSHCPRLTSLNLSYCTQLTDAALQEIVVACPQLDSLTLRQTANLTDAFLPAVAGLDTLQLLENPQLSLTAIRKLVTTDNARVHVVGMEIDITFLRNSIARVPFTVTINEFEPAQVLLARIEERLQEEGCVATAMESVEAEENPISRYKLRRVTYRKNGTKRPGQAHPEAEYASLVRELVEKKHHMYLDQNPNSSLLRQAGAGPQANDLFLTLRLWDSKTGRPRDLRDVSLPSTLTLADLKRHLHTEGSLPFPPERMFVVEEETDLRTNILATDAMSISMCGIISGDILHFEEITEEKLDAHTQQIVNTWTGSYLASRPVLLSIQETDDSFHRRRGKLTFLQENAFKFELKLKPGWSFSKLKHRIARRVGVAPEHLRLSTRVEPQVHLQGSSSQPAVEAVGGNLWLLLDIDCAEMLAEKLPIVIHHYNRAGNCASVQTILVRKNASLKQLKEKLHETLRIPEELQLISRLSSREVSASGLTSVSVANAMALNAQNVNFAMQTPLFVRQVYLQNSLKLNQLNLHHVRVDEMERPVLDSDLILQTVKFAGWKSGGFKTSAATLGPVRLIALPAGSKFNEVKAAIASNHSEMIDIDTMALKLASSTSLQRGLMFDIKPKYYQDHSPVLASTLMRPLDIVCWHDVEF